VGLGLPPELDLRELLRPDRVENGGFWSRVVVVGGGGGTVGDGCELEPEPVEAGTVPIARLPGPPRRGKVCRLLALACPEWAGFFGAACAAAAAAAAGTWFDRWLAGPSEASDSMESDLV
jgi:hypothetical protein